jgi:cell wall-associated NlpC family hydrolase
MRYRLAFTWAFLALLVPTAVAAATHAPRDHGLAAAVEALATVGARYHYGGSSPGTGFDCSGLVAHVYERAWGVELPRSTEEQRHLGRPVRRSELKPGDLVFYNTRKRPFSHVGIYLGDGDFVHAPRPGQRVRVESVNSPYWRTRFSGARRLDPPAD